MLECWALVRLKSPGSRRAIPLLRRLCHRTTETPARPEAQASPARAIPTLDDSCRFYRSGLTPRADAIVETSCRKGRRRATKQGRRRALGRALRLGTRLLLRCRRHCHRGIFRLGCPRFRLRRGPLDRTQGPHRRLITRQRRHLIVRHRGLILAVRSEQIAHEATHAA